MKKTVLYIAMSLDGYIADIKGDVSWLKGEDENNHESSYDNFIKNIDTIILGHRTYSQLVNELSPDKWPYEGMQTYVLTHRDINNDNSTNDEIEFTDEDIVELIARIRKNDNDKNIWICGGANVVKQFIDLDLIDRYHITVIPTILGDGIRLFPKSDKRLALKLIYNESINGMVDIVYDRSKDG